MSKTINQKLFELALGNVVSNAVTIGHQLGLFKKLAEIASPETPVTPQQLADAAGMKERYVREWCNCLACNDIIEVNEEEKFWIAPENVEGLTSINFELIANVQMPTLLKPVPSLMECFKKDGPHGLDYSLFEAFHDQMSLISESFHKKHIFSDLVPLIEKDLDEKLKNGGLKVLDVGCGSGFHSLLFAERYPNSHFTGLDISHEAIEKAKEKKNQLKLTNVDYVECDASKMNESWTKQFDLVFIFDACHDQMRPDLCLKEIHRVLKDDGLFAMIEVNGSSNVFMDKKLVGSKAALMYGISMYHCLPVGSNSPDALCYGSMWGQRRANELLKSSGFTKVETINMKFFPVNILYLSRK